MHSRKSVEPRMEPWGALALTGYSCADLPSRTTQSCITEKKKKKEQNILPEIPKSVKKTSMPNSVKSLGYIKGYSSSSPRPVISPSNSTRDNYEKICSWLRRPKIILEIRKKGHISPGGHQSYYLQVFKDFTYHRKETNRVVVFTCRPSPNILKYRDHQWDLENKAPWENYWDFD